MYPQNQDPNQYQYPDQPAKGTLLKKPLILALAGALLLLIVIVTLFNAARPSDDAAIGDPGYKLAVTGLKQDSNFGIIQGNELYAYNGAAFYKVALDGSNRFTVLNSGLKLPAPSAIYWAGSSGALMTFKGSFLLSRPYDILGTRLVLDTSLQQIVWYLDFASGKLTQATILSLNPQATTYSGGSGGFYYIPQPARRTHTGAAELHFFDTRSASSRRLTDNLAIYSISGLTNCGNNYIACVVGRDSANATADKVYGISKDGKRQELFDSKGRIFTTNQADRFIAVTTNATKPSELSAGDDHTETDFDPQPARLFTVGSQETRDLGFNVSQTDVITKLNADDSFYIFDQAYQLDPEKRDKPAYRAGELGSGGTGKSKLFALMQTNDKNLTSIVTDASHGNDLSLVTIAGGDQLLFTKQPGQASLNARGQQAAQQIVRGCIASGAKTFTYFDSSRLFQIDIVSDRNFAANVAKVSRCLSGKGSAAMVGYNYHFMGRDPVNGRLTTD